MSSSPSFLTQFSEEQKSKMAHAKRFKERYTADPAFRELVATDPYDAAKKFGIKTDPEEIRALWDPEWNSRPEAKLPLNQIVQNCIECDQKISEWNNRHKLKDTFINPNFEAWWKRQVARSNSELGAEMNNKLVHAPACFELSAGCTVGCWFCAISAEKFAGAFEYTPENSALWKDTLTIIHKIAGPATQAAFCYWATDPLDNPNYEKFISDFRSITGALPGTNTAKSHKEVSRVRSILKMWQGDDGFTSNHLSILTVKILDRIHEEFTAEELLWTGFNLVNKQSLVNKTTAGKARDKLLKVKIESDEYQELTTEFSPGTIACVSGFLFNMVNKTVKLISPCESSDTWPNGYKIIDESNFSSANDLQLIIDKMIDDHMPLTLPLEKIAKFRDDLKCEILPQGFNVVSHHQKQTINSPFGKELGELLVHGKHSAVEIAEQLEKKKSVGKQSLEALEALFQAGIIETVEKNTKPLYSTS